MFFSRRCSWGMSAGSPVTSDWRSLDLTALFLSLLSVEHIDMQSAGDVMWCVSPVCQTAVCSSRRREAGRARAAGRTDLCRCCSIWTSARAGYSRYTHTHQRKVLVLSSRSSVRSVFVFEDSLLLDLAGLWVLQFFGFADIHEEVLQ